MDSYEYRYRVSEIRLFREEDLYIDALIEAHTLSDALKQSSTRQRELIHRHRCEDRDLYTDALIESAGTV